MSEPWEHDHIHEKPEGDPHRVGRWVVGAALVWVFAIMGTVALYKEAKDTAKGVKQRLTKYNKSRRS